MARPCYEATEDNRRQVKAMAGLGVPHEHMATVLGITPKTLRKHFRWELDLGMLQANARVMGTLFKMATSGKNVTASIFWAKARCGMREQGPVAEVPKRKSEAGVPPNFTVSLD